MHNNLVTTHADLPRYIKTHRDPFMDRTTSSSFAPESPDLSSYYAPGVSTSTSNSNANSNYEPPLTSPQPPHHQHYRGSISHERNPYTPYQHNNELHYQQPNPYAPSAPLPFDPTAPHTRAGMPRTRAKRQLDMQEDDADGEYTPHSPPQQEYGMQQNNGGGAQYAENLTAAPASVDMGIVVKTKFPVARIKRIMQADDDVGKVAQVTPVAVSKALELFMISLITKSATEAKSRNSKRVGAAHLKQAITKDKQFDFLEEIVSKVADAPVAADKDGKDDEEMAAPGTETKKRRGAGRRRKKEDSD